MAVDDHVEGLRAVLVHELDLHLGPVYLLRRFQHAVEGERNALAKQRMNGNGPRERGGVIGVFFWVRNMRNLGFNANSVEMFFTIVNWKAVIARVLKQGEVFGDRNDRTLDG